MKKMKLFTIILQLFIIVCLFVLMILPIINLPNKITPTILYKDSTMIYMELIPKSNISHTWYDRKNTYYFQNVKNGYNAWSMQPEWRPYYYVYSRYDYSDGSLNIITDTTWFDVKKYDIFD